MILQIRSIIEELGQKSYNTFMKKRRIHYGHLAIVIGVCVLIVTICVASIRYVVAKLFIEEQETSTEVIDVNETQSASLQSFLEHALEPVGSTMYVWGGGWNKADTAAGKEAKTIGLSENWKAFYEEQDASYDYLQTTYQIHDGLDCSGYVGWVVYNTLETEDGQSGYVTESGNQLQMFEDLGLGEIQEDIIDYRPGDLMANEEHIYIVLGQYSDGSVLIVHASPPGVRICGTEGMALEEAEYLMSTYYPDWYETYPDCEADASFLTDYEQFRWNSDTMADAKKIQNMSVENIIELLFE